MSALDLPRIHFGGVARIHAPTGDRNDAPIFDLATHRVYHAGEPVPVTASPAAFHAALREASPRYDRHGREDPAGPFSAAAGWDFGGNGHFSWDARITAVQTAPGACVGDDVILGRAVDLWGHHNPYLGTTFNRARLVRTDPTSPWSTQILAGRLTLGRSGSSVDVPNLLTGEIEGPAPARWQRSDFIRDLPPHWLEREFAAASLHQFVVPREALELLPGAERSIGLRALARALREEDARGLVVQFALFNLWAGHSPDAPGFTDLVGTIGVHRAGEMRTVPAGRLLVPCPRAALRLGPLAVQVDGERASFNLPLAVPRRGRGAAPTEGAQTCPIGPVLDLGTLALRLAGGALVAELTRERYAAAAATGGIVDVPLRIAAGRVAAEPLLLLADAVSAAPLLREQEVVAHTDDAGVVIEPGEATIIEVRTFRRGRPASESVHLHAFYNPHAVPGWRHNSPDPARYRYPRSDAVTLVSVPSSCTTDREGRGTVRLVGVRSGACRVRIGVDADRHAPPLAGDVDDEPHHNFDRDDRLGLWGHAGGFTVRILPDDRELAQIPDEAVDYSLLYRAVLHPYELLYPFMADEVFSLADRCKVETYARLIWQMSDPANVGKTYYMPPTRDLSRQRTRLFRAYLRNVEQVGLVGAAASSGPAIGSRHELVLALREAVEIEQRVMLKYMFAAYTIPNYETGRRLVERGRWSRAELELACGDGTEGLDQGFRGALLAIAHEEMIHFLVANNLLRALGEPFYAPPPAAARGRHAAELDLSLAPMSREQVHAFIRLESPSDGESEGPISALYRRIRAALVAMPGLIVGCPGGEHHLFLAESYDRHHPDYQLEVRDLRSALFALDFVAGQGEGAPPGAPLAVDAHFQRLRRIAAALARHDADAPPGRPLWTPAYPVLRDPTRALARPGATTVTDPVARDVMALIDDSYALMLRLMSLHFVATPAASLRRSRLMNAAIDVMTGILRPLCVLSMSLPSGVPGRTAGPGFELGAVPAPGPSVPETLADIAAGFAALGERARSCPPIAPAVREMFSFYSAFFTTMAEAR